MVKLRAQKIIDIEASQIVSEYTNWCKNQSNCLYKNKKRKYHGWLNLNNLKEKNKVAQCGWDNGNCDHSTHYGIGGYHNICPIAGINGDYVWPAKLQLSDFEFNKNNITSTASIKSIKVYIEHRMVAIDTKTGTKYDNFGPNFHSKDDWALKVYFTNGNNTVSKVEKYNNNPRLSKTKYNSISFTFKDISISDLLNKNFALNIEYNHNYNTNPGIIYIRNVYIDVDYKDAIPYLTGTSNSNILYMSSEEGCKTTITHTINAKYKNSSGDIPVSSAPSKLGPKIKCVSKPNNVTVTQQTSNDTTKTFLIKDNSNEAGKKVIKYSLENFPKKIFELEYEAKIRNKPSYDIITEYKSNEDYDSAKPYIVFKDGCTSNINIYIDSLNSTPITLAVSNQNSSTNLLNSTEIIKFHNAVKKLPCGIHTLYIQRGDETLGQAQKNSVSISISPMNFAFELYVSDIQKELIYDQKKDSNEREDLVLIKRIDDEPQKKIPKLFISNETKPSYVQEVSDVEKGFVIAHKIDKYYAGEFYVTIKDNNPCSKIQAKSKITIESSHKQNFDYIITKGEKGAAFDFDYLVAWEGDNNKTPIEIDSIELYDSSDSINICSNDVKSNISEIGTIQLNVRNKTNKTIEGVEIELNTLIANESGDLEVTTSEWTNEDGIFKQFYSLFQDYNQSIINNVQILNLTPDNDFIDEENVYLLINKIDPQDTIKILLPFKSVQEKTVYLQYLMYEDVLKIHDIGQCASNVDTATKNMIKIDVQDLMLTNLEIIGNNDLLVLDPAFECPTECYTTKDVNDEGIPVADPKTGGITYKITNIDSYTFQNQIVQTQIINSNELVAYGCIIDGEYYQLIDNNNNPITINNQKLQWFKKQETINRIMASQNIYCHVKFPTNDQEIVYVIKTDEKGVARFFIPTPVGLNKTYTIEELLTNVLYFEFKEQDNYNSKILSNNTSLYTPSYDVNKNDVFITYDKNYKRYKPGEVVEITLMLSANIKLTRNYLNFAASLQDKGSSDQVTVLYKICNIKDNEGIFKTTFKTNSDKLIDNYVSKDIYCGLDTEIDLKTKLEKRIVEKSNLNVLYIDVENKKKENKDVRIEVNLGKQLPEYIGDYSFIDINIKDGDYSIENKNGNIYLNWLIGQMNPFDREQAIIKIKAESIGLSKIQIQVFDYLNDSNIVVKQSKCLKCEAEDTTWKVENSAWHDFDGVLYKLFEDGKYRRPTEELTLENGKYIRKWVEKE